MNVEETGEVMNLERIPKPEEAEAFEVDLPVGPTVTDPVTGEVFEHDPALVEADA